MKEEEAFIYVKKSLSIGIEQGYIQSYVDELYPMITLLNAFTKEYKKNDKLMQYAKELLNLTKEAMKNSIYSSDSQELMKLLTPMEKKVLHLIINAYSNKEIAEELCITPRTASAHTVNIYKKLGVKSRTQCIKRVNN
jgi:LuxR family maltose regulon positive regulatory protein